MDKNEIIIATALKLFVENGFHGTATSKIAQEAGVANGTLFNYFSTKEILIVSIYNSIVKRMDDYNIESIANHSVSKESFRSLFVASITWNLENPIEFQYLQQFSNSPYAKVVFTTNVNQKEQSLYVLLQNGIDLVVIKPMPVALLFSLFTAQVKGLYRYIVSNAIPKDDLPPLINETFELLWQIFED